MRLVDGNLTYATPWFVSSDRILDLYLEEVSRFPILSREGEVKLGRQVKRGDRQAKQEMIQCNLRLVISVARQYDNLGLPLLDVIEEGNIGLMRAVDRFDPSMEFRFSTYAVHWIRQGIRRALAEKGRSIRIPTYMAELVSRFRRHGRGGGNRDDVAELVRALRLPRENLVLIERVVATAAQSHGGLDLASLDQDGEAFAGGAPEKPLLDREDAQRLRGSLHSLSHREGEILRYRFGLDDYPVLTLEEIGEIFDLTRERIRQIEAQALDRMRVLIGADNVL